MDKIMSKRCREAHMIVMIYLRNKEKLSIYWRLPKKLRIVVKSWSQTIFSSKENFKVFLSKTEKFSPDFSLEKQNRLRIISQLFASTFCESTLEDKQITGREKIILVTRRSDEKRKTWQKNMNDCNRKSFFPFVYFFISIWIFLSEAIPRDKK